MNGSKGLAGEAEEAQDAMGYESDGRPMVPGADVRLVPIRVDRALGPEDAADRDSGAFFSDLLVESGIEPRDKDILVVSSKVAAIFDGGQIRLDDVIPTRRARILGHMFHKDPRKIQLVLEQGPIFIVIPLKRVTGIPSMRRMLGERSPDPDAMWRGFAVTNKYAFVVRKFAAYLDEGGIDHTNSPEGYVTTLPRDPCKTAQRIREAIRAATDADVAVIITDTVTMIGRLGSQDLAIGYAGLDPVTRATFSEDLFGVARSGGIDIVIDSVAGLAGLIMGQTTEKTPAVLVRGLNWAPERQGELPGMDAVAMPGGSEIRIVFLVIWATLKLYLGNLISFQRGPGRVRRRES